MAALSLDALRDEMRAETNLLIVQDLDGVCMPLVKDPLTRSLRADYVQAVAAMQNQFSVLTNGEHEGRRGVNRLVEKALGDKQKAQREGLYLPGLAAGGVQFQDRFGVVSHPGVSDEEMSFLESVPERMDELLRVQLRQVIPELQGQALENELKLAILDTQVSPTINLNSLLSRIKGDITRQKKLQLMLSDVMDSLMTAAQAAGLPKSFFLHVAPNLGHDAFGQERIKPAELGDVGTTDIQFMLKGAIKEVGLLVLINRHIAQKTGTAPLGDTFNVRTAPHDHQALLDLCHQNIERDAIPMLVGVGDTVTSTPCPLGNGWLRGGSDRGFLTLLQQLGESYERPSRVVLVDSSHGEVDRPNLSDSRLSGISDPDDPLRFDCLVKGGPKDYVEWFKTLPQP
jgi:glucosylglycerol 3-phosphatase